MRRISREQVYFKIAKAFSERSSCGRLNVGCVAVMDGRVICTGYNGALKNNRSKHCSEYDLNKCNCDLSKPCEKSIHAEANLIAFSARNGISLNGSELYITHSPCKKCSELIIQSGIKAVYYLDEFRDTEGISFLSENKVKVLKLNGKE